MKPFEDREPSSQAVEAMAQAAACKGTEQEALVDQCLEDIKKTTGHNNAWITASGGEAIELALSMIGGELMMPDQGVWGGAMRLCRRMGINTSTFETDLGVINSNRLRETFEEHLPAALLITSFAGYVAEQNLREVSKICRAFGARLIEDASFSIGDRVLAKGRASDIIVTSARKPKLLNLDTGGFISSNMEVLREKASAQKERAPDPVACAGITGELKNARAQLERLTELSERVKFGLDQAVHRESRSPCVGVLTEKPKKVLKAAFQQGLATRRGRSLFTSCPRFDRFLSPGIVIELKKVEPSAVDEAQIEYLNAFLNEPR